MGEVTSAFGTHDGAAAQAFIGLSRAAASQRLGSAAGESYSGRFYLSNPSSTTNHKIVNGVFSYWTDAPTSEFNVMNFSGSYDGSTNAIDGLQIYTSSGNIASGTFKLYGIN